MSDDGSSDQFSIEYDAPRMEINVETLTGTSFELLISPTDTIGSIKHRIQRVEGIPVVQQHLLFRLKELNNDDRLCDHGVTAGSTLRLVLSMRGGPVSTRRVPTTEHELAWREIKEYVDSTREDMIDKLPPGSKMSMFLFRDEENVHLIRVIENEDGTCYPYTDTWPPPKSKSKEKGKAKHRERITENHALMHKIAELRRQMEGLSLQKKARKPASNNNTVEYVNSDSCTSGVRARAVATAAAASAASEHSKSRVYAEPTLVENRTETNRSPLSETLESLRRGKSLAEIYSERLLLLEQRRNSRSHIGRSHRPQRVDPTRSKSDKPLLSARNCTIQTPSIAILEEEPGSTFNKKETDYSPSSSISVASGEANTVVTLSQIPSLPGTSRNLLHLAHVPRHHVVLQEHPADRPNSSPDKYEQGAQQFCNVLFNEATGRSHTSSATAAATSSATGTVKLSVTNRRQSLDYTPATSSSKTNLSRMQFASSSNPRIDSLEKSFTTGGSAGDTDDTVTYSRATLYNTTSNLLTSQFASTSKLNSAHLDNILGNRVATSSSAESGETKFNNDGGGGSSTTRSPVYGRRARIERIRNNVTENGGGNTEKYGYSNLGYIANIEKIQNDAVSINKQVSPQYSRRNLNFVSNLEARNTCDPTSYELRPFKLPRRRYDASPASAQQRQQDVKQTTQENTVHNTSTSSNCETLPAIVAKKPARSRCAFCKKRLNLTTIHTCRCGGMFCSQHRYSEVHECHYDYKTEGRRFLEQANPLVAAPKLPKI